MLVAITVSVLCVIGWVFVLALGAAAAYGDRQMARALSEREAREAVRPHGSVDRI